MLRRRGQARVCVLYENQPPERTGGFTVDDLVAFGEQAEVTGEAFETCVTDGGYDGWVSNVAASQQTPGDRDADRRRRRADPGRRPADARGVRAAVEQAAA